MIIKPLASEIALPTTGDGDTISSANLVRIINNAAAAGTVTVKTGATVFATLTVAANQEIVIEKESAQGLVGSAATLRAVKIGFAN